MGSDIPEDIRRRLQAVQAGVPQAGLPDRTFTRHQGCWNCVHAKAPFERWLEKREAKLALGLQIALQSDLRESDPVVVRIRREVDMIDGAVARHEVFICDHGRTADGNPVGDFVTSAFLCDRWSGRDGASLARADNAKLDELPEELRERIDGPEPLTPAQVAAKTQGDAS